MKKLISSGCSIGDENTKINEAFAQDGELPLGSIVDFCGIKLQVVEEYSCEGCYFNYNCFLPFNYNCFLPLDAFIGKCSSLSRFDRKSVIFKQLDENDKSN